MGGLKYPNVLALDKALKITLIRRILKGNEGWSIFPYYFNIHKIFLFGDIYCNTMLVKCNNTFWKDVIIALNNYMKMSGLQTMTITVQCQFGITIRSAIILTKDSDQKASYLSVIFFYTGVLHNS